MYYILSHRTPFGYLLHMFKFDLLTCIIDSYQVALEILMLAWLFVYIHFVDVRAAKALMRLRPCSGAYEHSLKEYAICTPILCMCESSEGSDASEHLLIEYAICTPILCMCESSEGTDRSMHVTSSLRIGWKNMSYIRPFMCMFESSEGSGETACILRRVWAFTDGICHMYAHFVHVREQWRLWQACMHASSSLSIGWKNMSHVRPFMCMCESSEGSGETACTLRRVWAFTDGICHMYAHFVHVREQWRLWRDCTYANASLSIDW